MALTEKRRWRSEGKQAGRPLLGLLTVLIVFAIGYWLGQSSGPERIVETQDWVTDRLMLMQSDDFDINEARLRDLIEIQRSRHAARWS